MPGTLDAAAKGDKDTRILRADKAVPYGEVMEVMNLLRTAGVEPAAAIVIEFAPLPVAPAAPQTSLPDRSR